MYPISSLISEHLKISNLSKINFIKKLGYKNTNKGLRHLSAWLNNAAGSKSFLKAFANKFNIPDTELQKALSATRDTLFKEQIEQSRINFAPYIYAETELKVPSQITISILAGYPEKTIPFPAEAQKEDLKEQIVTAVIMIDEHYQRNKGNCPFFGKITGYRFVYAFEESVRISTDLKFIEQCTGYFDPGLNGAVSLA